MTHSKQYQKMIDYQLSIEQKIANPEFLVEYLRFNCNDYQFNIAIKHVVQILCWDKVHKIAGMPEYVLGILIWQQKSMTVVSLEKWLYKQNMHYDYYPLLLCCQYKNYYIAFAVSYCNLVTPTIGNLSEQDKASILTIDDAWFTKQFKYIHFSL